ncbi:MAG: hypothetical protein KatS3mg077_0577 [Candidatus Binatia bacterium]|nr:MAG: hypothetical protein KatS3mg077_0577 [Candidatus Binatia bacterium]
MLQRLEPPQATTVVGLFAGQDAFGSGWPQRACAPLCRGTGIAVG